MRIAIDTSILAYAEGVNDIGRQKASRTILAGLLQHQLTMPVHVAGELFHVLVRKMGLDQRQARAVVIEWQARFADRPVTTDAVFETALDLAADHGLQIFDAIILAASAEAGCRLLLSEDMQDGFVWRGVTVVNPYAATLHPLLADALRR